MTVPISLLLILRSPICVNAGAINPNSLLPSSPDLSYKGSVFTGGFGRSNHGTVDRAEIVNDAGYSSPVRTPRGRDIMAACGQLKSASERARKFSDKAEDKAIEA